jgi:hypothetical protein
MELIQIVPHLPPPDEGVGNYALALSGQLRDRLGIEARFVVGDPAWPGSPELGGGTAVRIPVRRAEALPALLGESAVLLHYAGYGYQSRGCPAWLVDGLLLWQRSDAGRRLVTIFHEVYAGGPPWRSSFWTSPLQRRLAAALARCSESMVTSLDLYGRMLRPWAGGREITVLPVFSTVGEPAVVPPFAERARRMIVFGGAGVRGHAYGRFRPALAAACAALGVEEIMDIGSPIGPPVESLEGIPVRRLGVLPPQEVSSLLLGACAGFVAYPPAFLPKSTIFAAYCAHGLLPVCAWYGNAAGETEPGLFWDPASPVPESPGAVAEAARSWYMDHSLPRQTATWRELLAA